MEKQQKAGTLSSWLKPLAIVALVFAVALLVYVVWSKLGSRGLVGGFYTENRGGRPSKMAIKGGCGCMSGAY